ncbi:Sensor protein ZraS [Nymphon striatum]|nr:Sensor protein ZraS [Nymphon striatum]
MMAAAACVDNCCPTTIEKSVSKPVGRMRGSGYPNVIAIMQSAADSLGVSLEVVYGNDSPGTILDVGKSVLNRVERPDYLVMVNDLTAIPRLMEIAQQKGQKTFLFNAAYKQGVYDKFKSTSSTKSTWFGSLIPDDEQAGYLLAKELVEQARRKGLKDKEGKINIIGVNGNHRSLVPVRRETGLRQFVIQNEDVNVKHVVSAYWGKERAQEVVEKLLLLFPETTLIWSASDLMSVGAALGAEQKQRKVGKDILTCGIDCTFVTMLATTSQLYLDYKKDIDYLDTLSTQIPKKSCERLIYSRLEYGCVTNSGAVRWKIESFELLNNEIVLEGNRSKRNELDVVVSSINELLLNLKDLWESFRISENNFYQLVDNSSQGVLISTEGNIDFCNKEFLRMFGFKSLEDIDSERFSPYLINYGKDIYDVNIETLHEKNQKYKNVRIEFHLEELKKDFLCYTSAAIWNNKFGTLLMFVDVTEAVLLKKRLREQQAELIQKDKMNTLGVMVTGITHEVNNPNNLIRINAEVIQNSWKEVLPILDEHYKKHPEKNLQNIPYDEMRGLLTAAMEDTASASKRIEKIISGLSTFIRGDDKLTIRECDLPTIIIDTIKLLQPQIKKRNVEILFDESIALPSFEANGALINQVFVNLVLNAVEACDQQFLGKDVKGEVRIDTSVTENSIYVIIKDNGVGIKEDEISKVFDLFQSSKSTTGGTGIGLSIVYALIKLHQGEISVESEEGFGSTFTVRLPIKQTKSKLEAKKKGVSLG